VTEDELRREDEVRMFCAIRAGDRSVMFTPDPEVVMKADGNTPIPTGVHLESGKIAFVAPARDIPQSLAECKNDEQMLAWAFRRVGSAVEEHPNDADRANALMGLGVLVGLARRGMP
jgi:hypothetical protein